MVLRAIPFFVVKDRPRVALVELDGRPRPFARTRNLNPTPNFYKQSEMGSIARSLIFYIESFKATYN